jgi:hypothetical protein
MRTRGIYAADTTRDDAQASPREEVQERLF